MSKALAQRHVRLTAVLVLALVAGAAAASSASAAPPIGTNYCMDGRFTFATWDAASQHVADKVVNQFAGFFTAGEVDGANAIRPPVQQFYDALETSDAIGNYGVDTTIPNYAVHTISLGLCPATNNHVFLCYSKFNDDPGVWPAEQAQSLIDEGYWSPTAMDGTIEGGTNIGGFHLTCNPPALDGKLAATPSSQVYVGGAGEIVETDANGVPGYYPYAG
jgi:hypothetical protein